MRTTILTAALVVLTTLTFAQSNGTKASESVYTSEDLNCVIYPSAADQVTLIMNKADGEKVKLVVRESDNSLIYLDNLKRKDTVKISYDVSEFPAGNYTFELVKDREVIYSQSFSKTGNSVAISR